MLPIATLPRMRFAKALADEFRKESAATRTFLERFPADRADFRPHEKSITIGELACHVIELPEWAFTVLRDPEFNFAGWKHRPLGLTTAAAMVEAHDRITERVLEFVSGVADEAAGETWTMRSGDHVRFKTPRAAAIREFVLSHLIHHRGQLSVYFRLLDVPVPGAYGPSADDRQG